MTEHDAMRDGRSCAVRPGGVSPVLTRALALFGLSVLIAGAHWWTTPNVRVRAGEGRAEGALVTPPHRPPTDPQDTTDAPNRTPGQAQPDDAAALAAWLDSLPTDIGTDAAFRLWDENLALFIDARPVEEYEAGHVP